MVSLRPITASDRDLQRRLFQSTRPDLVSLPLPPAEREALIAMQLRAREQDWSRRYGEEGHAIVIDAESQSEVGEIWIHRSEAELRLVDIAFLPEHRSRGRGTAILRQLIEEARAKNVPLRLSVIPTNPARRLYERLGFKTCEVQVQDRVYQEMELRSCS
jgi:ribosomal protein S18 acetylase RimI-like enzyme